MQFLVKAYEKLTLKILNKILEKDICYLYLEILETNFILNLLKAPYFHEKILQFT